MHRRKAGSPSSLGPFLSSGQWWGLDQTGALSLLWWVSRCHCHVSAWSPLTGQPSLQTLSLLPQRTSPSLGAPASASHIHAVPTSLPPRWPLATGKQVLSAVARRLRGPKCTCPLTHLPSPERQTRALWFRTQEPTRAPPHQAGAPPWPLTCLGACSKALSPDSEQNSGRGTPQAPGHWEQPPFVATDLSDRNARSQGCACCGVTCRLNSAESSQVDGMLSFPGQGWGGSVSRPLPSVSRRNR